MRTTLLICLTASIFFSFKGNAQICYREVNAFAAAPGGFAINGKALLQDNNGIVTLYLDSAFSTTAGPDLHVYLASGFNAPTVPGNTNIVVAPLQSNAGQQSFAVPSGTTLTDYNYVLIHCNQFNHFWGGGMLGAVDCAAGMGENNLLKLAAFYNSGYIYFKGVQEHSIITVFDLSGKVVFHGLPDGEGKVDAGELHGVYIVTAVTGTGRQQGKIACF